MIGWIAAVLSLIAAAATVCMSMILNQRDRRRHAEKMAAPRIDCVRHEGRWQLSLTSQAGVEFFDFDREGVDRFRRRLGNNDLADFIEVTPAHLASPRDVRRWIQGEDPPPNWPISDADRIAHARLWFR